MTASVPRIISLEDIDNQAVGGKAFGLARLQSMGLDVPAAFVLSHARRDDYPVELEQQFQGLGAGPVAVRSSAAGEDGADASFAGQYESVLNVEGMDALKAAINHCVECAGSDRADSYRQAREQADEGAMHLVIQSMVDARCAGVVFTADPVSARRDVAVVDVVAGLGEALVSGEATPDHYEIDAEGVVLLAQKASPDALLSDDELKKIVAEARSASAVEGVPLDLEWAIDQAGHLFWLQARPITTLPADLNEFDTPLPRPDDVLTISNVSEMMPGAVCPLTGSFTGWSIDYGLQHMQVTIGARERIDRNWQITAWAFGHLFLNLTGNIVMASGVLGSTAEQTAQTLCGRIVPELKELPAQPLWRQVGNTLRLLRYAFKAPKVVDNFGEELAQFRIPQRDSSAAQWAELAPRLTFFEHAMAVHIQSSALSGFLSSIVENMVSGRANDSTAQEQGEAVRLLAGATEVESAVMLEQLDELVALVAQHPDAQSEFAQRSPADALSWLRQQEPLSGSLQRFLQQHGHRGYRELCMRDPAWVDDPEPLVQSMQAAVTARLKGAAPQAARTPEIDWAGLSRGLRWALPKAHNAIRRREHTKSQLVDVAHRYKCAFRRLGGLLETEGALPEADLVFFFSVDELRRFVAAPNPEAVEQARLRREALAFQQRLSFGEIAVGHPQPIQAAVTQSSDGKLQGRPASSGSVEGTVRVAHTLAEAAELQAGEILVTPITDIGWTPYFSMIGGLVTDLGSSVSHGAVIAREYGLPCVVNTLNGTLQLKTGDRVRVDGDSGSVELLSR
ncbi:MAG: PEP/pyruvate-binding domain-containing protein [Pseudomonadota bacterium]